MSDPAASEADARTGSSLAATLLGLILVAALAWSLVAAWNNPAVVGRYTVKQAYALLRAGRYTEATALLEHSLLIYNDPETHLALSFAYLSRLDTDRAGRQATLVLASGRPDLQPAAWSQLGRVLRLEGHSSDAFSAWSQAETAASPFTGVPRIEADKRSAAWHIAMLHWSRGEWEGARLALQSLVGTHDVYGRSAVVKLAQLLGPTDPGQASQLLSMLNTAPPAAAAESVPDLRVAGLAEGLLPQAISGIANDLQSTLKLMAAQGALPAAVWGEAYLQEGEMLLAQVYLARVPSGASNAARYHAELGLALIGTGDTDAAVKELQTAISLDPKQAVPYSTLAEAYIQQRNWVAAEQKFARVTTLDPNNLQLQLQLGRFYSLRGEYGRAEDAYKTAATLEKAGFDSAGADAQLSLARFYIDVRGEGCTGGLAPAQESLARHPGNAYALDAVGWALALCGKLQDSLSPLEKAVALAGDVPSYRYHLARVYAKLGRTADARTQYTRVLDFDPSGSWSQLAVTEMSKLH